MDDAVESAASADEIEEKRGKARRTEDLLRSDLILLSDAVDRLVDGSSGVGRERLRERRGPISAELPVAQTKLLKADAR